MHRYFPNDKFQAQPQGGFTELIANMLRHPNIEVLTGTALEDIYPDKPSMYARFKHVYFTGPIDQYFRESGLGKLQYRSIRFNSLSKRTAHLNQHFIWQPGFVVNYPGPEV